MIKPISISLSPNTERDDILLAFKKIFQPFSWKIGNDILKLEARFKDYLGGRESVSFNSGRSALYAILKALNLEAGDEILLQAFTCNATVNPLLWLGLKPIYVDCDKESFNIDVFDLEEKITSKAKAVLVQHTFGMPADLASVIEICSRHNLILIEDCAHSLGAEYEGQKVGTFGKVSFFSFSRDKIISSVYGGMATTSDLSLAKRIHEIQTEVGQPSPFWIFQQLLHPVLMNWMILPTYRYFGKFLLVILQGLHLLSKAVHFKEKRGLKPGYFPYALPNALAGLALNQMQKLEKFNEHRRNIATYYRQDLADLPLTLPLEFSNTLPTYLRFSVRSKDAHEIIRKAWKRNYLIGDWYTTVIAPFDTKLERVGYQLGSCPKAEELAKETFNLPTHIGISKKETEMIISFLKKELWK